MRMCSSWNTSVVLPPLRRDDCVLLAQLYPEISGNLLRRLEFPRSAIRLKKGELRDVLLRLFSLRACSGGVLMSSMLLKISCSARLKTSGTLSRQIFAMFIVSRTMSMTSSVS
jgi:hypothetical protein